MLLLLVAACQPQPPSPAATLTPTSRPTPQTGLELTFIGQLDLGAYAKAITGQPPYVFIADGQGV